MEEKIDSLRRKIMDYQKGMGGCEMWSSGGMIVGGV